MKQLTIYQEKLDQFLFFFVTVNIASRCAMGNIIGIFIYFEIIRRREDFIPILLNSWNSPVKGLFRSETAICVWTGLSGLHDMNVEIKTREVTASDGFKIQDQETKFLELNDKVDHKTRFHS